jgi:alkanesulfonate monooxygenase SsuD/methylene tetrahydromethanopterin reductase-like flavin-dependent oxidoreductase (luciferase family)
MRFGIFDHVEQRPGTMLQQLYAERLDYVAAADQAGFWCYFKSEHHLTPLDAAPCPSVLLAAVAQRTTRLRFGPLVYLLPFHHPLRLLEEVAMLDHLADGRLEVGVGRGIAPPEHAMWGLEPDAARNRSEETLEVLLQGFAADKLDFDGRYWSFHEVPVELHPLQQPHPPLWYPGNVEIAGRRGFNTVVGGPIRAVAAQAARYHDLYDAHASGGRGVNPHLDRPIIAGSGRVFVGRTDAEAEARARRAWAAYTHNITLLWKRAGIAPSDMPLDPSAGGDFDRARSLDLAVAGSAERVRDHVERYAAESGTDHLVVSFAWGDLTHAEVMASFERFVEHVVVPLSPAVPTG